MKRNFAIIINLFLISSCFAQEKAMKIVSKNEPTEWSHTFVVGTDKTNLPKVLLIGDSHVERYYPVVSEKLKDVVYCSKFTTSRSLGDPVYVEQLKLLFLQFSFDIIFINNGLHGGGYKIEEYKRDIPFVYHLLQNHCRKTIVWVNTTAWRVKEEPDKFKNTLKINERNEFVNEFTKSNNIPLIDFYSISVANKDYYCPDYLHFNSTGVNAQSDLICSKIKEIIK
jgi:hypothetical protein